MTKSKWQWLIGLILVPIFVPLLPYLIDAFSDSDHHSLEYDWSDYIKIEDTRAIKVELFNFSSEPQTNVTLRLPPYLDQNNLLVDTDGDKHTVKTTDKYLLVNFGTIRPKESLKIALLIRDSLFFVENEFFDNSRIVSDTESVKEYTYATDLSSYYRIGLIIALLMVLLLIIFNYKNKV